MPARLADCLGNLNDLDMIKDEESLYTITNVISNQEVLMKTGLSVLKILIAMLLLSALGCATAAIPQPLDKAPVPEQPEQPEQPVMTEYLLQPGDNIDIKFFHNPELNENVTIRPDGKISLQLIGEVFAAGSTPARLEDELIERYREQLKTPEVAVIVKGFEGQKIYVGGEVNDPQALVVNGKINALQAIFRSGGFTSEAKMSNTVIVRRGENNRAIIKVVDLDKALDGRLPEGEYQLLPYDIVYVPKTRIASIDQFMTHLYSVLPGNLGFGLVYEINSDD